MTLWHSCTALSCYLLQTQTQIPKHRYKLISADVLTFLLQKFANSGHKDHCLKRSSKNKNPNVIHLDSRTRTTSWPSVRARCGHTNLESSPSGAEELKTGGFFGVSSQVGHQLHVVVDDMKGTLLLLICRDEW